jgi:hypothetical protein
MALTFQTADWIGQVFLDFSTLDFYQSSEGKRMS